MAKIVPPREAFTVEYCGECPHAVDASELFRIKCSHEDGLDVKMPPGKPCPSWCPLEDAEE